MSIYTNIQPWSSHLTYQDLTKAQKQARRIELLLLNNPAGLFMSHLQSNLRITGDEIASVLCELNAKNVNGFWVHPHYFLNVAYRGMFPAFPIKTDTPTAKGCKVMDVLSKNPDASITYVLRQTKIKDPRDLISLLKSYLCIDIDLTTQFVAGNFLYRRFNIKQLVVC